MEANRGTCPNCGRENAELVRPIGKCYDCLSTRPYIAPTPGEIRDAERAERRADEEAYRNHPLHGGE